jgi:hypothetical protein
MMRKVIAATELASLVFGSGFNDPMEQACACLVGALGDWYVTRDVLEWVQGKSDGTVEYAVLLAHASDQRDHGMAELMACYADVLACKPRVVALARWFAEAIAS